MLIFSSLLHGRWIKNRIAETRGRLYRLAYAWTHNTHLADDLTQDTVAKALKSLHQLDDHKMLDAWLFTILHNCWRDHHRRRRPDVDIDAILEQAVDEPSPERQLIDNELTRQVRGAVSLLPLGQRQVVTLVDLEEMSYAQAAQVLNVPIGTVMSRLCRARTALRGLLREYERDNRLRVVNTKIGQDQ